MSIDPDPDAARFAALSRVYGNKVAEQLPHLRICIVGIGGVGSWAAEALARSGVGKLVLIDADDVTAGNTNRQIHAMTDDFGKPKVSVMEQRIGQINPLCEVQAIDDMLVESNLQKYIDADYDYVIDAIDSIRFKAALIHYCKRHKIKIITTGGAGGRIDPGAVSTADLSLTWNDALAAKVRSRLRADYGFSKNPQRRFGIECVYSSEQPVYPDRSGEVSRAKPGVAGATLDCDTGYGSTVAVTATFGMIAAARALNKSLARRLGKVSLRSDKH